MLCFSDFDACLLRRLRTATLHAPSCPSYASCDGYLTGPKSCFEKVERLHHVGSPQACQIFDDQAVMKELDDAFVNDIISSISGGGKDLRTRRCNNDTSTTCTDDTPCTVGGGTCASYFGAPLAFSAGSVSTCVTNQRNGALSGTYDPATGAMVGTAKLLRRIYLALTLDEPCPTCDGGDFPNDGVTDGTCTSGPRNGLPCDGNGESPTSSFGVNSLDCPPSTFVSSNLIDLTHTNDGVATAAVTAGSPTCNGQPGKTCLCGSCSGDAQIACRNDGECTLAGAGTCTNGAGTARKVNGCIEHTSTGADESICICSPTGNDQGECPSSP